MTTAKHSGSVPNVPMLDLSRQYAEVKAEIEESVLRVCASQRYVLGPEVTEFEAEAAAYLGVKHAVGCASGTDALWLSLQVAGVGPGDEVITTPFSFFATASSIIRAGARPVFADVDPKTLNLDPAAVEHRLRHAFSSKIKAIMPVHLYGQCADMDALRRTAREYGLALIEDAAQAFGATWRGKHAGSLGDLAGFSFYPTKNLSGFGDGGMVTTNDDQLAAQLRLLRNHGSSRRYYHEAVGWNSRLDSIQAAILRVNLRHLDKWNQKRKQRASAYDLLLGSTGLLTTRNDEGQAPVRQLEQSSLATHIYHQYVLLVERRDALREFLSSRQIGSEVYYPVPLHLQECFNYLGYSEGILPVSEEAGHHVIALPIYPDITADEQAHVINTMAEFYS